MKNWRKNAGEDTKDQLKKDEIFLCVNIAKEILISNQSAIADVFDVLNTAELKEKFQLWLSQEIPGENVLAA